MAESPNPDFEATERNVEAPRPYTEIPLRGARKTIAIRMHASLQEMAQITLHSLADVTPLVELKAKLGDRPIGYNDLFVKAVALTLRQHPALNATMAKDVIRVWREINVGVAVAFKDGLAVPVLRNADKRPVSDLAAEIRRLADAARSGQLSITDVMDGTFTVTNLGAYPVDGFTPVINPPQVAILGIGRIVEQPAVVDGRIVPRHRCALSLTFDHRAVDGVPAAAFLKDLEEFLQAPEKLVEE